MLLFYYYSISHQHSKFEVSEGHLSKDLNALNDYFKKWRLVPNASKTEVSTFHLNNKQATYRPTVVFDGKTLAHNPCPKYLGVTLDRSLTFGPHLQKLSRKLGTRNNILHKLTGTTWGANADVLRTTGLSLVYSAGEYCAPAWLNSAHTNKIDAQLRTTMRCISGTVKSTPVQWLPALSHIPPPHLRRQQALLKEANKIYNNPNMPAYQEFHHPPQHRLKSRHPPYQTAHNLKHHGFGMKEAWKAEWLSNPPASSPSIYDPTCKPWGFSAPRRLWCQFNRLRTGHGRCAEYLHRCGWRESPACDCGALVQSIHHIIHDCPNRKFFGNALDLHSPDANATHWVKNLDIIL